MLTAVGPNPSDLTHPKRPFVSTQSVAPQTHPISPPPLPTAPPPSLSHRPLAVHPQSFVSDSASGYAAGDVAERQKLSLAESLSGVLSQGKVIVDPVGGNNHVVWVVSDSVLDKQKGVGSSGRKKKSIGGPLFSPLRRMLTRNKRRSATDISVVRPHIHTPSPVPTSSQPSSQSLDGHHLVRTIEDMTQRLIAKSNTIVNLDASVTDLSSSITQLKTEVEQAKTLESKYAEDIRALREIVANQEKDVDAKDAICKEQEAELSRLAEQVEALTAEKETLKTDNVTLKTDLETSNKQSAEATDQNENQEELILDLQAVIEELQEQVNFLSTERDSFKKYFAIAKLDAAQKSEELREKIIDLLDKQRDITVSIRKGLPLGRIALKKVLQKTEQFLEIKAQKQMLQQKVDFLSNKSFVQHMYIVDLRQVIVELSRVMYDHRVTPGYALRRALIRLNMPFDEVAQTQAVPYRWDSADETTSDESSFPDTVLERRSNDSHDSGSGGEYPEERDDAKWKIQKKRVRTRPPEEQFSEAVSGSEDDDAPSAGGATARYGRRLSKVRT